jgi:hypothetical protein
MFNLQVEKIEIKGKEFQIELLPAGEGITIAHKLSTVILPLVSFDGEEGLNLDFGKLATSLTTSLGDKDLLNVIKRVLKNLCVDGKEVVFDNYFRANYGELIKILTFAFEKNFGSFFEELVTSEE